MTPESPQERPRSTASFLAMALAGFLAIAIGGVVYGKFTHRWGGGADVATAVSALDAFPASFGPWRQESAEPMDDDVLDTLQCAGYVNRTYLNVESGEQVRVASIVGPAGPTAVHTPEICYSSGSFNIENGPSKAVIDAGGALHSFWKIDFSSRQPGGPPMVVYYAWTVGEAWNASDTPRFEYGGRSYLYKIQVAGIPRKGEKTADGDPCKRFLTHLLDSGWTTGAADE